MNDVTEPQQQRRALVVDDDVSIRLMLTKILQREQLLVDSAKDGVDALEKIRANQYDLVFLDLMMPRLDGLGVLRYLRTHEPQALKTVIVMTAFNKIADEVYGEDMVGRVVSKPFDIHVLIENARKVLAEQEANRAAAGDETNAS